MFTHTLAQEGKEVSPPFFIISSRRQRNSGGGGGRRLHVAVMRVSMFRWRDRGTGIGAAFEHFLWPLFEDFDHKFCLKLWFCYPKKRDISSNLNNFPVPGVRNLTKEIIAKQKEASNPAPIPVTAPPSPTPSVQTLIPA